MNIIFLLLTCSIIIAILFLGGFIWSVRSGQYDDSYTPSVRMLFDDPPQKPENQDPGGHHEESRPQN